MAKGYNRTFGARPINRLIKNEIESLVAKSIIAKQMIKGQSYHLDFDGQQVKVIEDSLN